MTILNELPWEGLNYMEALLGESSHTTTLPSYIWLPTTLLCFFTLGVMGLRLPTGTTAGKWIYTFLGLALILIADWLGGWGRFGIPYLIILIRGCIIFKSTGRLILGGVVLLLCMMSMAISFQDLHQLQIEMTKPRTITLVQLKTWLIVLTINSAFSFGLTIIFVLMLVNALLSERQSRQKLTQAHDKLREYALKIENQATLQERNRIAREIHDSLGHALTAQSIQLENALLFCQSNSAKTQVFLSQAKHLAAMALQEIRQSVATLRSNPLEGRSLKDAINSLIQDVQSRTNITPNFDVSLTHPFSTEINTTIYRIIQEALTNICKHSDATKVTLQLRTVSERLYLFIEDNGKGFDPEQNTTGFGLQSMRERTEALRGKFYINSAIALGCRITVDIPIPKLPSTF
ncbi:MAG: sensor histidine kinase [Hydrococcus sp. RU_2_2]|jgi:signal transduction histidine kinase|nr:sensor histidine kinase [Hydrococcus sp. RU_2_2]NJP17682.1 sensor histidine kinase [Hydrococcus sp. CRU_1_1]